MNAAAMIRRFEAGGFTHEQAVCLAETLTDELHVLRRATSTKPGIMTNHGSYRRPRADGSVMHIVGEFDARLVMRMQRQRRWFAGIVVVQVAVIGTATVALAQVFG